MIKVDICEECGHEDITGFVACEKKQLCPECTSQYVGLRPMALRLTMMDVMARRAEREHV